MSAKLKDVELKGNTVQQSHTGKNMFSFNNGTIYLMNGGSMSVSYDDNSCSIEAIGTQGAQGVRVNIEDIDATKTYTFSGIGKKIASTASDIRLKVAFYHSDNGVDYIWSDIVWNPQVNLNTDYSFSLSVSGHRYYRIYCYNNGGTPVPIGETTTYRNLQFEEGNKASSYEPFVPSVAPDNPSEAETITGQQDIIFSGKNMLDFSTMTYSPFPTSAEYGRFVATAYDDRIDWVYNPSVSPNGNGGGIIFNNLDIRKNQKYTFRFRLPTAMPIGNIRCVNNNNFDSDYQSLYGGTMSTPYGPECVFHFTANNNYTQLRIYLWSAKAAPVGNFGTVYYPQLELGEEATSFELPTATYSLDLGDILLERVSEYRDYIYKAGDNNWYLVKETARVVLDSNSQFAVHTPSTVGAFVCGYTSGKPFYDINIMTGEPSYKSICNRFIMQKNGTTWTAPGKCGFNSVGAFWCMMTEAMTLEDFNTWLDEHETYVIVPIKNPTRTQITDSTLVNKLNSLANAYTYGKSGATKIMVTASSGLDGQVNVTAFKNTLHGLNAQILA